MNNKIEFNKIVRVVGDLIFNNDDEQPNVIFKVVDLDVDIDNLDEKALSTMCYNVIEEGSHARASFKYLENGIKVGIEGDFFIQAFDVNGQTVQRKCIYASRVTFIEYPKKLRVAKGKSLFEKHAEKLV